MAPTIHVLDPDYDTVITLKDSSITLAEVETCSTSESCEIHYHVSSRHLQLASPWFKRAMAQDTWVESRSEDGKFQIVAHDWDEGTFLLLLNIFHLRNKQVPRVISLETLAKVGVLVDYYECGEAVEMFTAVWIATFKKTDIPSTFCRSVVLWIWIAWIFDLHEHFEYASIVAIKDGKMAMDTLGLPIPASVSSKFESDESC